MEELPRGRVDVALVEVVEVVAGWVSFVVVLFFWSSCCCSSSCFPCAEFAISSCLIIGIPGETDSVTEMASSQRLAVTRLSVPVAEVVVVRPVLLLLFDCVLVVVVVVVVSFSILKSFLVAAKASRLATDGAEDALVLADTERELAPEAAVDDASLDALCT